MSFDRQAARALFNSPDVRTPDRTPRRAAPIQSEAPRPRTAPETNAVNPGIDEKGDLYARLSRPPKRSKASVMLPVLVGVGLIAGVGVIVLTQTNKPTTAESLSAPMVPPAATAPVAAPIPATPAPAEAAAPTSVEPTAATPAPAVKATPARAATAAVRPSRPAARPAQKATAPSTRTAAPEPAPTPVNPPTTATAPSAPAPIVLPPPLPAPTPEPAPQL